MRATNRWIALLGFTLLRLAAKAQSAPMPIMQVDVRPVSIELAGVTDGRGHWWNAAGVRLKQGPYSLIAYSTNLPSYEQDVQRIDFAFRVSPATTKGVAVCYLSPGSQMLTAMPIWTTKTSGRGQDNEVQIASVTGGYRVLEALYPAKQTHAQIMVGIASGPWATSSVNFNVSTNDGSAVVGLDKTYIFSPLVETKSGVVLMIATSTLKDDVRILALDAKGKEKLPTEISDDSAGNLSLITAHFGLTRDAIHSFRIDSRPYRWVTFNDVALTSLK